MRRSLPLAVLLCAAVALVLGAAGLALANGSGDTKGAPGTAFELAAKARSSELTADGLLTTSTATIGSITPGPQASPTMMNGPVMTVPLVTVPDLTTSPDLTTPPEPTPPEPTPRTLTSPTPTAAEPPAPEPTAAAPTSAPPARPAPTTAVAPTPAPTPAATPPAPSAPPADAPLVPPYTGVLGWTGEGKVAYLTFDDGPGPATGRILEILAASRIKATFCMLGTNVTEDAGMAARVVAEGHTVCNHSWDHHSPFDALPRENLDRQIGLTQKAIASATGVTARYFRAPEGRFGDPGGAVLQAAQRARTIPLGWAVDSEDWRKPGSSVIVANVLNAVTPGAVILLHDAGGTDRDQTVAALPAIIAGLQAAGYTLAALPPDPAG